MQILKGCDKGLLKLTITVFLGLCNRPVFRILDDGLSSEKQ